MLIKKGQHVQVKGNMSGSWKDYKAADDFNTGDQRWKLYDIQEREVFEPLGERCKIQIIHDDGVIQPIKYKKDSEVWDVIKEQISRSNIRRYSWELIFGESLTRVILRYKMKGFSPEETFQVIKEHAMIQKITKFFPEQKDRLEEKIYISVNARYGENNSAQNLYDKEFKK